MKQYMTTFKERTCYWTYFIGQNIYYNITAVFISTYLIMQGIDPIQSGTVLLIVKIWDAINDPIFGFIFTRSSSRASSRACPGCGSPRRPSLW